MGFPSLPQGANTCLVGHKRHFSSLFFIINNSTLWQKCTFLSVDLGRTWLYPSHLFPSNLIYLWKDTVRLRLVLHSSIFLPRIGSSQKMATYHIFKQKSPKLSVAISLRLQTSWANTRTAFPSSLSHSMCLLTKSVRKTLPWLISMLLCHLYPNLRTVYTLSAIVLMYYLVTWLTAWLITNIYYRIQL